MPRAGGWCLPIEGAVAEIHGSGSGGRSDEETDVNEWVDVSRLTGALVRQWKVVVLAALSAGILGFAGSLAIEPVYRATTSVLVGTLVGTSDVAREEVLTSQALTLTFADLVKRELVLEGVVEDLGLTSSWQSLRRRVRAEVPANNAQLIVVHVEGSSPAEAEEIAGAIAKRLVGLTVTDAQSGASVNQRFVSSRLEALRMDIEAAQAQIDELTSQLAQAESVRASILQSRIDRLQETIIRWESNYSSLAALLNSDTSPSRLQVVEGAVAGDSPVRPDFRLNTVLMVFLGLLAGAMLAIVVDARAQRRAAAAEAGPSGLDGAGSPEAAPLNGSGIHEETLSAPNGRDPVLVPGPPAAPGGAPPTGSGMRSVDTSELPVTTLLGGGPRYLRP